jgi:hypothetical protein
LLSFLSQHMLSFMITPENKLCRNPEADGWQKSLFYPGRVATWRLPIRFLISPEC